MACRDAVSAVLTREGAGSTAHSMSKGRMMSPSMGGGSGFSGQSRIDESWKLKPGVIVGPPIPASRQNINRIGRPCSLTLYFPTHSPYRTQAIYQRGFVLRPASSRHTHNFRPP